MKLDISKEWCLKMAELEGDHEVGAGALAADPTTAPTLVFWYRNYKGEEGYRCVKPVSLRFGTSEYHKEPQWLLLADDTVNHKRREFAMKDMSGIVGTPTIWISGVVN